MNEFILSILFLFPIAILLVVGLNRDNKNKVLVISLTKIVPAFAAIVSAITAFYVFQKGVVMSETWGFMELGFSVRLDTLSVIMYSMVSIIGLVALRFSYNYLEGDVNHVRFLRKLSTTIAFVLLMVISGNILLLFISWVATSIALHKLLVFYPNRKKAVLAARKKFIVARIGDISFLTAITLIYLEFSTGNLEIIFQQLMELKSFEVSFQLELAAVFLVLTAGLKSAQIPFHGWLLEVMESPTPVSALLHAGLLNAGPFLLIRFSFLLDVVSFAPVALFLMGAATALYGAIVFTTQPNIKTALAYSSIAHMGFSFMICGLGVYAASLLHLMAHSFYKAHAFLSSGSVIEKVLTKNASNYSRKGNVWRMILGFIIAAGLFFAVAKFWGVGFTAEFQLLIIGGVIFAGISSLLINAVDSNNFLSSIFKILGITLIVLMAFFGLEQFISFYLGNQIPGIPEPTGLMIYLAGFALLVFIITILTQTLSPVLYAGSFGKSLGVHARNGFYLNVVVDRLFNSLNHKAAEKDII